MATRGRALGKLTTTSACTNPICSQGHAEKDLRTPNTKKTQMKTTKKNNQPVIFRLRAECDSDARIIRAALRPWLLLWQTSNAVLTHAGKDYTLPDVEVEFGIGPAGPCLGQLQWIFDKLADCHVAAETVSAAEDYTGERVALETRSTMPQRPTPEHLHQVCASLRRLHECLTIETHRTDEAATLFEVSASAKVELPPDRRGFVAVLRHAASGRTSIHRVAAARDESQSGREVESRMRLLQQ